MSQFNCNAINRKITFVIIDLYLFRQRPDVFHYVTFEYAWMTILLNEYS